LFNQSLACEYEAAVDKTLDKLWTGPDTADGRERDGKQNNVKWRPPPPPC